MTTRLGNLHREYNYWYPRGVEKWLAFATKMCLRPLQEQVISFVQGSDVFVGLPTGSGKSLCYNILPDVFNSLRKVKSSIAVIVSPTDERPGTGIRARLTLCAYVYARMQLIGSKIPIAHSKRFQKPGEFVFLPRACVEKTGWFTRLGVMLPQKILNFRPSEVVSGAFWVENCFLRLL